MRAVVFDPQIGDTVVVVAQRSVQIGGEQAGNTVDTHIPIGTMLEVEMDGIDSDEEVNVKYLSGPDAGVTTYVHFSLLAPAVPVDVEFTPEGIAEFLGES